ncbi:RNA ligase family protein [Candidatus Pacearchaeota archaeon]|jgi:ATP-dependent RNA circularization protein (DNA/RNA ligase family)|nr:RNA ligase family protein [Candidatus Pacearchaeota archaeon]
MNIFERKPLGIKNYGSIPHLSGSRLGPSDSKASPGHEKMAIENDKLPKRIVLVTEKIDGSNVGILRYEDTVVPLTRAGYVANTSPFKMHQIFHEWVFEQKDRFLELLNPGDRVIGEWCIQAHGTKYNFKKEPFFIFDYFNSENERITFEEIINKNHALGNSRFNIPYLLYRGETGYSVEEFNFYPKEGREGALEECEGAVWRVEYTKQNNNKRHFILLVKYVKSWKEDGIYLKEENPVWNTWVSDSKILRKVK